METFKTKIEYVAVMVIVIMLEFDIIFVGQKGTLLSVFLVPICYFAVIAFFKVLSSVLVQITSWIEEKQKNG